MARQGPWQGPSPSASPGPPPPPGAPVGQRQVARAPNHIMPLSGWHGATANGANLGGGGVMGVGGLYSAGHWQHGRATDIVVSLILCIMLGLVVFVVLFFWRKYRTPGFTYRLPPFVYSELSQCDGDSDFTEVADDLGVSHGSSSTDEEELEPATIPVTSSYISSPKPQAKPEEIANNNDIVSICHAPLPLLPLPPISPSENPEATEPRHSLLSDSDEELLQ